jgi:hypothetical protein
LSLAHDERIAFRLAGTVGLPSPYPATGSVYVVVRLAKEAKDWEVFLRIVHRLNVKVKIGRLVQWHDVRAILARWKPASETPPAAAPVWAVKLAEELRGHVYDQIQKEKKEKVEGWFEFKWLSEAIVYVPESASVYMQVGVGLTAAESAEYYPPLAPCYDGRPRCDSVDRPSHAALAAWLACESTHPPPA